ncbi:uncharacterized protein LOC134762810 [Penaeus indicus]|uniref:uncharacterized protein LOC134762810 n=1 Tax=Penaeus indicus TaxID=29960 RepID=UPI00300CBC39
MMMNAMTEPRRISRVGLLDPPPDEGPRSLDAALLLRNLPPSPALKRHSGGFDNVGFDLESFGEATRPGSRRPFVSVHVRTLPPEEHVRSTLSRQPKSLPPTPILNGLGGRRAASTSPFLQQNGLGGQWRHHTGSVRVIHIHDDEEAPARVSDSSSSGDEGNLPKITARGGGRGRGGEERGRVGDGVGVKDGAREGAPQGGGGGGGGTGSEKAVDSWN